MTLTHEAPVETMSAVRTMTMAGALTAALADEMAADDRVVVSARMSDGSGASSG